MQRSWIILYQASRTQKRTIKATNRKEEATKIMARLLSDNSDNVIRGRFILRPEFLKHQEIQYELRVRGLDARGDTRSISQKLRSAIEEELIGPIERQFFHFGVPSQEFKYVTKSIHRLETLLLAVTNDEVSQNRCSC